MVDSCKDAALYGMCADDMGSGFGANRVPTRHAKTMTTSSPLGATVTTWIRAARVLCMVCATTTTLVPGFVVRHVLH